MAITTPGANKSEAEAALRKCSPEAECELRIGGETYVSVPLDDAPAEGSGRRVHAEKPAQPGCRRGAGAGGASARVLDRRIDRVGGRDRPGSILVQVHRSAAGRGGGPFARKRQDGSSAGVSHRRAGCSRNSELTDSFNHAAASIREGQDRLVRAYVEFVELARQRARCPRSLHRGPQPARERILLRHRPGDERRAAGARADPRGRAAARYRQNRHLRRRVAESKKGSRPRRKR